METWTQDREGDWKRWSNPALGLDALAGAPPRVRAILVVGLGPPDDEQLVATIRLARRLAGGPLEVIAGSVHPTALWRESVRRAGADRAFLVSPPSAWCPGKPPFGDAVELGDGVCPALHAGDDRKVAWSVCGRHNDRMVLARHHFDRWCLAANEECPHWQGATRG